MVMRVLVTAVASALLAGCVTVGPDYKAAPVEPVSLQGAADAAFSTAPPVANWWAQFDDPVLG
ncbi:MAG: TolC family protein, partial [Stenotrophomonas sp.]